MLKDKFEDVMEGGLRGYRPISSGYNEEPINNRRGEPCDTCKKETATMRYLDPKAGWTLSCRKCFKDKTGIQEKASPAQEMKWGKEIEKEHGTVSPATNITDDDPVMTKKIAQAHVNEIPDYYTRLRELEKQGKAAMKNKLSERILGEDKGFKIGDFVTSKYESDYEGQIVKFIDADKVRVQVGPNDIRTWSWHGLQHSGRNVKEDFEPGQGIPDEQTDNLGTGTKVNEVAASPDAIKQTFEMMKTKFYSAAEAIKATASFYKVGPDYISKILAVKEATHGEVPFDTFDKKLDEDVDRYWVELSDSGEWYKVMVANNVDWSKGVSAGMQMARFKTESEAKAYIEKLKNAKKIAFGSKLNEEIDAWKAEYYNKLYDAARNGIYEISAVVKMSFMKNPQQKLDEIKAIVDKTEAEMQRLLNPGD